MAKADISRSLRTNSLDVAIRRAYGVAADFEAKFEQARLIAGLTVDQTLLGPLKDGSATVGPTAPIDHLVEMVAARLSSAPPQSSAHGANALGDVYDRYIRDPTHDWSPRTRLAYETTRRIALSIIGENTPVEAITRENCRQFVEALRWLPRNAAQRFPRLSPYEASAIAREQRFTDLISTANANAYLNKLSAMLNWAVREGLLARNPAKGLRIADQVARRDKRRPFSPAQLRRIFSAPLYAECRDGHHRADGISSRQPTVSRIWVPLIALYAGMRLNEICQLDISDVRPIDGVQCFVITEASEVGSQDKRLKTASSERIVPVHQDLIAFGLLELIGHRRRRGEKKLFGDLPVGRTGYRSSSFSKWFRRFLQQIKAERPMTCFHSFRHTFRDSLRDCGVPREIAMALGGWSSSASGSSISDSYGDGFSSGVLAQAINKVQYSDLNLDHLRQP